MEREPPDDIIPAMQETVAFMNEHDVTLEQSQSTTAPQTNRLQPTTPNGQPTPRAEPQSLPTLQNITLYNQDWEQLMQSRPHGPYTPRENSSYQFQVYWELQRVGSQLRDALAILEHEHSRRKFSDDHRRYLTRRRTLQEGIARLEVIAHFEGIAHFERIEMLASQLTLRQIELDNLDTQWRMEEQRMNQLETDWDLRCPIFLDQFVDEFSNARQASLYEMLDAIRQSQIEEEAPDAGSTQIRLAAAGTIVHQVLEHITIIRANIGNGTYDLSGLALVTLDSIMEHARAPLLAWSNYLGIDFESIDPYRYLQAHERTEERPISQLELLLRGNSIFDWDFPTHVPALQPSARQTARQNGEFLQNPFPLPFGPASHPPVQSARRMPRMPLDDHCAICYTDFSDALTNPSKATWCLTCGQNAHSGCIRTWHEGKPRYMRNCPFW